MILRLLTASIRHMLLLAALATVAAIAPGRSGPSVPPGRAASQVPYQVLDQAVTALHGEGTFIIHRDSGQLDALPVPPEIGIDKASLSPWKEDGRRRIVGVGWNRSRVEGTVSRTDFGLIRMALPDGEILDRVPLSDEALPMAAPCWLPGAPASVLFVGGDYRLYRVDFGPSRFGRGTEDPTEQRPCLLEWQARLPGAVEVHVRDLAWPDEPRLNGRALVSLRFKDRETGRHAPWQIWWLRLNGKCTSVVEAGPLLEPEAPDGTVKRRFPVLVGVRGEPALAYLAQRTGEQGYRLRVAPIHFDPGSGLPGARETCSRPLAEDCAPTGPVVSPDGRRVTVVHVRGPRLGTERIAVPGGASWIPVD